MLVFASDSACPLPPTLPPDKAGFCGHILRRMGMGCRGQTDANDTLFLGIQCDLRVYWQSQIPRKDTRFISIWSKANKWNSCIFMSLSNLPMSLFLLHRWSLNSFLSHFFVLKESIFIKLNSNHWCPLILFLTPIGVTKLLILISF